MVTTTTTQINATGLEAQSLATRLLQRIRRTDPLAGVWEAADVQWWWRKSRPSDEVEQPFWVDDEGPVAGVVFTAWGDEPWQCDPLIVPGAGGVTPSEVWERGLEIGAQHSPQGLDIPVSDGDPRFEPLARRAGLGVGLQDSTGWIAAADRPDRVPPADGFRLVDRTQRMGEPHPMRDRNGAAVAERLSQCTLYDPTLDLRIEAADGRTAGYALFWFDPNTRVGLVEPVRVEDEFQRRGLAGALVREGVNRLFERGADRVKISYQSDAAEATYRGVGFRPTSTSTWYQQR